MEKGDSVFILEVFNSVTGIEDGFIFGVYASKEAAQSSYEKIKDKYQNRHITQWKVK